MNSLKKVAVLGGGSFGTVLANSTPTGIHVARPQIFLNDAGLYAELQKKNVSDVSLAQSKLFIKSQLEVEPPVLIQERTLFFA